ncbi:MAG: hypothetical protein AAGF83_05090 [Cyanobacteria bacterium P01_G01_bin.67]
MTVVWLGGCTIIPSPDPYPHQPPAEIVNEAKVISRKLESYINQWLRGEVSAQIPSEVLPASLADNKNFVLRRPQDIDPRDLWITRERESVNLLALRSGVPDPNATYLLLKTPLAPFGHKVVMQGEFPRARFFGIQITPPVDGYGYYPNRVFGSGEVPLTDVDIKPMPGHTNPYNVGADRLARNRSYRVSFTLKTGDPVALNPSFRPPYRGRGNSRVGSFLVYQGPWGTNAPFGLDFGKGDWELGALWVRIYAPDRGTSALGGVHHPRVWFESPRGEKYVITSDASRIEGRIHDTAPARVTAPQEPRPEFEGPTLGWNKSFGILLSLLETASQVNSWDSKSNFTQIRNVDKGATGRGYAARPPHNYEPHATSATHNSYIGRSMSLGDGKVIVLTGKLPTFPKQGKRMTSGQVRYWSVSGYDTNIYAKLPGVVLHSIMDEEVVLDRNRYYVIAYSQPEDRPINATHKNGVTWKNWGPTATQSLVMRYLTVRPEWSFRFSPDEINLPWKKTARSSPLYDRRLLNTNDWNGFMGPYLPRIHYLTREQFEKLPSPVRAQDVPLWN